MSQHIALSAFWPGFELTNLQVSDSLVNVQLEPDPKAPLICNSCSKPCSTIHDRQWRTIRDLPMLGRCVRLNVLMFRLACPDCGPRLQQLSWLCRYSRVTQRLSVGTNSARCWYREKHGTHRHSNPQIVPQGQRLQALRFRRAFICLLRQPVANCGD